MSVEMISFTCCFIAFLQCLVVEGQFSITENLTQKLLGQSNPDVRPFADIGGPRVLVDLTFTGAEKLIERPDVVQVGLYVHLNWTDPRVAWNPSDYKNITTLYLPAKRLWLPNFALWESANPTELLFSEEQRIAVVTSDGTVDWTPKGIVTVYAERITSGNGSSSAAYRIRFQLGDWDLQEGEISVESANPTITLFPQRSNGLQLQSSSARSLVENFQTVGRYPLVEVTMDFTDMSASQY